MTQRGPMRINFKTLLKKKGMVSLGCNYSAENRGVLGSLQPFLSPHGESLPVNEGNTEEKRDY